MRTFHAIGAGLVLAGMTHGQLAEPWRSAYTGDDAAGDHVLAHFAFDGTAPTRDGSGNGHGLTWFGATPTDDGRFGGGLRSRPGWPREDRRHAAIAYDADALSPRGAFSLELWLRPDAALADYGPAYLIDKKYASHHDYQLLLDAPDARGRRRLQVGLGFGDASARFDGAELRWEPSRWYHVALRYDGAGTLALFRDGVAVGGGYVAARGAVSPGPHPLSIGDRVGSYYRGFPGTLDEVRLLRGAREYRDVAIAAAGPRTAFLRGEADAALSLTITNLRGATRDAGELLLRDPLGRETRVPIPPLAAGARRRVDAPIATNLRPDRYRFEVELRAADQTTHTAALPFEIVRRRDPSNLPVVLWGPSEPEELLPELPRIAALGFTHTLGLGADYAALRRDEHAAPYAGKRAVLAERVLDRALREDLRVLVPLTPGRWLERETRLLRVDRHGATRSDCGTCAAAPASRPPWRHAERLRHVRSGAGGDRLRGARGRRGGPRLGLVAGARGCTPAYRGSRPRRAVLPPARPGRVPRD